MDKVDRRGEQKLKIRDKKFVIKVVELPIVGWSDNPKTYRVLWVVSWGWAGQNKWWLKKLKR